MSRTNQLARGLLSVVLAGALAACAADEGPGEGAAPEAPMPAMTTDPAEQPAMAVETSAPEEARSEEHARGEERSAEEHGGEEHAERHDSEGEEPGHYITAFEQLDEVRNGARLRLVFDPGYGNFVGRVDNTTSGPLCGVRVEVHLDTGVELGPTESQTVAAAEWISIEVPSGGADFERWNAHVEQSACRP